MNKSIKLTDSQSDIFIVNDIYSTQERIIGKWIDGKPIYRKVLHYGYLANSYNKSVSHGLINVERMIHISVSAQRGANQSASNFEYLQPNQPTSAQAFNTYMNSSQITITTNSDRSAYDAYVIFEYTKTTD